MATIPNFLSFSINESRESLAPRWEKWIKRFETYLLAFGITDPVRKKALLLYHAGEEVQDVFDTLTIPQIQPPQQGANAAQNQPQDEYTVARQALNHYFLPRKNTVFEEHKFRRASQHPSETIDEYHTRLRTLAMSCGFADTDLEIFKHIIQTCTSQSLRRKALREPGLTLDDLLTLAKSYEQADRQASVIEENRVSSSNLSAIQPDTFVTGNNYSEDTNTVASVQKNKTKLQDYRSQTHTQQRRSDQVFPVKPTLNPAQQTPHNLVQQTSQNPAPQ